jgi:hypothetical protein
MGRDQGRVICLRGTIHHARGLCTIWELGLGIARVIALILSLYRCSHCS